MKSSTGVAPGLAFLVSAIGSPVRTGSSQPWNAREVNTLTKELGAHATEAMTLASRPMPQGTLPRRMNRDATANRMSELEVAVQGLLAELLQGQGPDQTQSHFDVVAERVSAAREFMAGSKPTMRLLVHWQDVDKSFVRPAAYYGVDGRERDDTKTAGE
jgi:hypothetical protein